MKKKTTFILVAVLVFTIVSASAVLAKANGVKDVGNATGFMFDAMRNWSRQAQEKGEITGEEAKAWEEHFEDMEEFHRQYGFPRHCGGFNRGMMRGFSGNGF